MIFGHSPVRAIAMNILAPLLLVLSGTPPAAPAQEAVTPTADGPAERAAPSIRGGELMKRADAEMVRIQRGFKEVLSRVEDARNERDLVKLLCADEKLARIKVLVDVAERADISLAEAIATGDESIMIEYSKIAIARGKVDALRTEAAACIGLLAYEAGERTTVYVEVPEYLPKYGGPGSVGGAAGDPYRSPFGIPSAATAR
jgi:hypothetical protein